MPLPGLSLRRAGRADLVFLHRLFESFRAPELALLPWTPAQKGSFVQDQFRLQHVHFTRFHPKADFWIVEQPLPAAPPRAVGRLYLDRSGTVWRIIEIGFLPDARGHGLGGKLLTWLQRAARAAGVPGIDLHVAIYNPRAQALYERLGFRETPSDLETHRHMQWRAA